MIFIRLTFSSKPRRASQRRRRRAQPTPASAPCDECRDRSHTPQPRLRQVRVLALMQFTRCANDEREGQDSLPRRAPLAVLDERGRRGRKGVRTDALPSTGLSTASNQVRFHGTAISSSVKTHVWMPPFAQGVL